MTWQRAASVAGEGADEDPAEGVANRRQSSPPRKEGRESESESEVNVDCLFFSFLFLSFPFLYFLSFFPFLSY